MISPPFIPSIQQENIDKLKTKGFKVLGWVDGNEAVLNYADIFVRVLPCGKIVKNEKPIQDKSIVFTNPEYWGFSPGFPYEEIPHSQHAAYLRRKAKLKLTKNKELWDKL